MRIINNKLFLLVATIIILFICAFIKIPHNIKLYGKVIPSEELIIQQTQNDVIKVIYKNLLDTNKSNNRIYSAERGDIISLEFRSSINVGSQVNRGDTLCFIRSNETKRSIEEIKGELFAAKEVLNIFLSSEKESIVKEAKAKHSQAVTNLQIQERVFSRYFELYSDSLISDEDFEYQKILFETSKADVIITEAQLEAVKTAAKPEQLNHQRQIISNLENQLDILIDRRNEGYIISTLNGTVSYPTFNDTILFIKNFDASILIAPVQFKYYHELNIGQKINLKYNNGNIVCSINFITDDIININGKSVVYVVAEIDQSNKLIGGQILSGKLKLGQISVIQLFKNFLN